MNPALNQAASRRIGSAAVNAPRMLMSWEDWLTLGAALVMFVAVGASIHQAHWVREMPSVIPTILAAMVIGMFAARIRVPSVATHPAAVILGAFVVLLAVQSFAEGATFFDRVEDTRFRLNDWWAVVRSGDVSNDTLPFVALVHSVCFLAIYLATYSVFRWHNPWIAIIPAGIVLLINVALQNNHPTGALVFFLFGAVILIARLHLQKNQAEWKRKGVEYPEWISLNAVQLTLMATILLLLGAWYIPTANKLSSVESAFDKVTEPFTGQSSTFNRLFHNVDARNGSRLHSFGSLLALRGDVRLGSRALYDIKAGQPGFIRATSYDTYTGTAWKTGDRDSKRIEGGDLAASPEVAQYKQRTVTILQVTVKDGDNTVLSAGMPLGSNVRVSAESPADYAGEIEQLVAPRGLRKGDTYNSIGSESTASPEQLRAAGTAYPEWVTERYLQLPKDIPQRVRDESRRVAVEAGAATPFDVAVALEAYLRAFPYDLAVEVAPPGQDFVDYILFDLKRGYFDYQATAMAVMLRTLGVPARVAVGFVLNPTDATETTYAVSKDDQYSWVEVFFPTYGWVNFNPTADKPEGSAIGALGTGAGLNDPAALDDLNSLFGDISGLAGTPAADALSATPVVNEGPPWTLIWSLVAALVGLAALAFAGRTAWNWGLGGLEGPVRLWARTQRLAGWAKLGATRPETPRQWSNRLGHTLARPNETSRLADAFEEARYGRPDLQRVDPATTEDAYKRVRNTLFRGILRRGRWDGLREAKPAGEGRRGRRKK
ncbi:MAG: transglutaminase-like domain-containing protein [Dehalococcoidia bacterium]